MKPRTLIIIALLIFGAFGHVMAQNDDDDNSTETPIVVTDDQVNAIANRLFCPVCENIPLDACGTAACADWRNEIRLFLEQGMTEEEIRTNFVRRFGDRVVGVPQDPFLNALSVITPWILVGVGLLVVLSSFITWRKHKAIALATAPETPTVVKSDVQDPYLDMLEKDLKG
ncbi:MAG: cytochrome c-type biogenesis protein CcmH [bacterium]|nr:cytochrome c-type biogenesis protein CcmH [bacterium]